MSEKLSLLDNSSDSEVELTINKNYANSYNQWRNKEELQKYKDLKKEEDDSESSSESEEEIPEFDEEFFRALSLLKSKDPRIYQEDFELFRNKEATKKPKAVKEKSLYMKDYERKLVLEKGGKFSDEEDETDIPEKVPTYDEEQEELKKSFKEAVKDLDVSDNDADDLLQVRTKTKKEEEAEEDDYVKWLKGEDKPVPEDVKKDMSYLREFWNDPKLDDNEKFLKDYILNKRYLEKDDSEIPTYEELTSGMLSDDEKMIEEQEKFEHKYNFRFEEPDEEFIKRYPRTVGDSLRRTDNRRKQKREEKAERRQKEKEQRREELKRLKALKRKEIEEKFLKLKEISGQEEINLNESDIESDFDPDKHDQKMREMFNDEYYEVEEDQKPQFPYDEELDAENWNSWAGEKIVDEEDDDSDENTTIKEEGEGSSQCNLTPREVFANEMISAARPKKKVKKKSLFAKIISQSKPIYDPDGKPFEEYLDEYYKLDFEDVVGDLPVRYKYRKVVPNDFGLTVDEILGADDRELNRWCSVKKTCQYRKEDEEFYDVQAFQKKAQNPVLKKKILSSIYAPKENNDTLVDSSNLKTDVKEVSDLNNVEELKEKDGMLSSENNNLELIKADSGQISGNKRKRKKNKNKINQDVSVTDLSNAAGNSKDEGDTKFTDDNSTELVLEDDPTIQIPGNKKKRKKKKSKNQASVADLENAEEKGETQHTENSNTELVLEGDSVTEVPNNKKKQKKKKVRVNQEASNTNYDISDVTNGSLMSATINESLNSGETTNQRSVKRKRELSVENSEVNDSNDVSQPSKHKCLSQPSNLLATNVLEGVSEASAKKKKKKKKKNKLKGNETVGDNTLNSQKNSSKLHQNKFKDKCKQYVSEDKRLGLSDARLAAYGINPKKFKNKIIYSKK